MVVSVNGIYRKYGEQEVLKGVSFFVGPRDKVALVGRNGCGKTTLLRMIAGLETPDEGSVTRTGRTSMAFRPQENAVDPSLTVMDEMKRAWGELFAVEDELVMLDHRMEQGTATDADRKRHNELWGLHEALGGHTWKHESERILEGLGLGGRWEECVGNLSGGEKTKLSLAKLLAGKYDLLMLDEPSNHLDIDTTKWLEDYLVSYPAAVLLVTHDRSLLRRVATRIVEVERGSCESYNGGYDLFMTERELRRENKLRALERQRAFIAKEQEYIRRNIEGQNTKQAQGRRKRLARVELLDRPVEEKVFRFPLKCRGKSGEIVFRLTGLGMGFGARSLFSGLNLDILRGDRLAVVGPNGVGKTTLLRILNGALKATSGEVKAGASLDISFFDQEHSDLEPDDTPVDVAYSCLLEPTEQAVRNVLGAFGFPGLTAEKSLSALSGGEKTRLALMKVVVSGSNLLMLDEPTNHLDIASICVLEDSIASYEGTLILVSHDREFIRRTCRRFLVLGDECKVLEGVEAFNRYIGEDTPSAVGLEEVSAVEAQKPAQPAQLTAEVHRRRRQLSNELKRQRRELAALEEEVMSFESDKSKVERQMIEAGDDYRKAAQLSKDHAALVEKIERSLEIMVQMEEQIGELDREMSGLSE